MQRDSCASLKAQTTLAALDVVVLMDSSGSMGFVTADGTTKWASARKALAAFLTAPASAGMGAAMTFFPQFDPGVPERCSVDADCGVGACSVPKLCMPDVNVTSCDTSADCSGGDACKTLSGLCFPSQVGFCTLDADCAALGQPGDQCTPIGACAIDNVACLPGGPACPSGGACEGLGVCLDHTRCDDASYQAPETPMADLPGGAGTLLATIDARTPAGGTPTLPAVRGAVAFAKTWGDAHPTHKVVVVLATDGLPTLCDPSITVAGTNAVAAKHVADAAAAGAAEGLQTYVIGVFAPDEEAGATMNLDTIAAAGGTGSAYLIQTSEVVSEKFLEAFTKVREAAAHCTYAVTSPDGSAVDFASATVTVARPGDTPFRIYERSSLAACDPSLGGFYPDPSGETAKGTSKIVLCPATCDAVTAAPGTEVDISLPCPK